MAPRGARQTDGRVHRGHPLPRNADVREACGDAGVDVQEDVPVEVEEQRQRARDEERVVGYRLSVISSLRRLARRVLSLSDALPTTDNR